MLALLSVKVPAPTLVKSPPLMGPAHVTLLPSAVLRVLLPTKLKPRLALVAVVNTG